MTSADVHDHVGIPADDPAIDLLRPLATIGVREQDNSMLFALLRSCHRLGVVTKLDHATFVCRPTELEAFTSFWGERGFRLQGEWQTRRHPARHIAYVRGATPGYPWEEMIGVSVSDEPDSPINRFLSDEPSGPGGVRLELQHVAMNVAESADIDELRGELEAHGLSFMTPVLRYDDDNGAGLRQLFTSTDGRFFVEFVQRITGRSGEPFGGFDPGIIDDLYDALAVAPERWAGLSPRPRRRHAQSVPSFVHTLATDPR